VEPCYSSRKRSRNMIIGEQAIHPHELSRLAENGGIKFRVRSLRRNGRIGGWAGALETATPSGTIDQRGHNFHLGLDRIARPSARVSG